MLKKGSKKQSVFNSNWLILSAPLLAYPFMVNLRVFPFIAPNEEPKWAILTLCALWMGLAAAWLWFKRSTPLQFEKTGVTGLLLITYVVILGIGIFIGPNTTEGSIRFAFWFFCIAIFITSAWAIRHEPNWMNWLSWSIAIGSFIFSLRYWESYIMDFDKPNYNIHVLFSPIGHVNFTGDVLIILLPLLLWLLTTNSNPISQVLNWFSVTSIFSILLLASSRGALGGLIIATVVCIIISVKHYPSWKQVSDKKRYFIPMALALSALLASYITYNALPYHYRDLVRISSTAGKAVEGDGKIMLTEGVEQPPLVGMWIKLSPLLTERTSIYAATTAMTLDKPLLGQGTGNFAWVYPSFSNRYPDFRDPLSSAQTFTTNPHNVVLQIASQNGLPAMLIFMGLLLYFWYRLVLTTWRQWDGWFISGLATMTAAIFDAMFNHVFFNPASMFVFALLAGSWWGLLPYSEKTQFQLNPRITAITTTVVVLLLSIWPARWLVSEWYAGQAAFHARQPALEASFYQKAYNWDKENFRAVFGMGQVSYKQKDYAASARYFEEFEKFYPYNPPALNMLGAAYMSSGQFLKAKEAFQRALKIYPGFDMVEQNLQRIEMILNQQKRYKQ